MLQHDFQFTPGRDVSKLCSEIQLPLKSMGVSASTSTAEGLGSLFFCLVQFVSNCYDPSDGQLDFLACFQIVRLLRPDASSTSPKTKC